MAKRIRILPLADPPCATSSDDDETSSDEESKEQDSGSEEPESPPIQRSGKAIAATPLKTVARSSKRQKTTGASIIKRIWSEDDEKTLLQRLIDFHADKGTNPFQDKTAFYEFVKGDLSCQVSKYQTVEKIRTLRRKYIGTSNKRADQSFSKPHNKDCLRLAMHVWGPDGTILLTAKNAVEEGNQVFSHSDRDKEIEEDDDLEVFSISSEDGGSDNAGVNGEDEVLAHVGEGANGEDEVLAHVGEGANREDEVLAHVGEGANREDEVLAHVGEGANGEDEVLAHVGGMAVAQDEALGHDGVGSSKNVVESEVLARGAGSSGKKVVEEGNEGLARGAGSSGKKVVEEGNEDLARGAGDSESQRDPDWFGKSVLGESITSYGVADDTIKERWTKFSEETKKELEEEWKSLESKQLQVVSEMIKFKSKLASMFAETI